MQRNLLFFTCKELSCAVKEFTMVGKKVKQQQTSKGWQVQGEFLILHTEQGLSTIENLATPCQGRQHLTYQELTSCTSTKVSQNTLAKG